jgi:Spy/CpxP family protein refolding chaperone
MREYALGICMIGQKVVIAAGILALIVLPMTLPSAAQLATPPGTVSSTIIKSLDLTPEQKPKVEKIQGDAAAKVKAILNPAQLKQLSIISKAGKTDAKALKALNLSQAQQTQLNTVQTGLAQELFSVLTPEQQQKLLDQMIMQAGKSQ